MSEYVCLGHAGQERLGLERYCRKATRAEKAASFFHKASKKAFFITSVPFYWFILFKHVVGWFNPGFFAFVVISSIALSKMGGTWGIISAAMR